MSLNPLIHKANTHTSSAKFGQNCIKTNVFWQLHIHRTSSTLKNRYSYLPISLLYCIICPIVAMFVLSMPNLILCHKKVKTCTSWCWICQFGGIPPLRNNTQIAINTIFAYHDSSIEGVCLYELLRWPVYIHKRKVKWKCCIPHHTVDVICVKDLYANQVRILFVSL